MSQRAVELLIGRLLTDEDLRDCFARSPREAIARFCDQGWELSRGEVEALAVIDGRLWTTAASRIPSRLQRCRLSSD